MQASRLLLLVAGGILPILTACAPLIQMPSPSADGPRISNLVFDPSDTFVGCTVTMRFHYQAADAEITGGLARWSVAHGRRLTIDGLALPRDAFDGKDAGDVSIPLTLRNTGSYRYRVQIEDSMGRRSNVLEQGAHAEVTWAWWIAPCAR